MQIHCIPRPGKRGRRRIVYEAATKFAFHHVNAYEVDGGDTIVVDTCASDTVDFGFCLDAGVLPATRNPSLKMTLRRLVLRGSMRRVEEYDMGVKEYSEMPSPLAAADTGRPHNHFFVTVRPLSRHATVARVCAPWVPSLPRPVLQTGRRVARPDRQHGFMQSVIQVEVPPSLGVSQPFDAAAVKTTEYYPGARCVL